MRSAILGSALLLVACGGSAQVGTAVGTTPPAVTATAPTRAPDESPPPPLAPGEILVKVPRAGEAVVGDQTLKFEGESEALVWPALAKAIPEGGGTQPLVVEIGRDVPQHDVHRVIFTLRANELRVQSQGPRGAMRFVMLRKRADEGGPPPTGRCHLAVFLRSNGALRVAAPGGKREVASAEALVAALEVERQSCPIRYVAFGAEDEKTPFGPVFDVMLAVDSVKAAGDARYVLAEAVHPPGQK